MNIGIIEVDTWVLWETLVFFLICIFWKMLMLLMPTSFSDLVDQTFRLVELGSQIFFCSTHAVVVEFEVHSFNWMDNACCLEC